MERPDTRFNIFTPDIFSTDDAHAAPRESLDSGTLSVLLPIENQRWTIEERIAQVQQISVPLNLEIVIVDDGTNDGTGELLQAIAQQDPRIQLVRHATQRGRCEAIRTAIERMRGAVAVIHDPARNCDLADYPRLVGPILENKADAVFGSRMSGAARQVGPFWSALANSLQTSAANWLNNSSLSDLHAGCLVIRGEILKQLRLTSRGATLAPELACRLAQWGARIHEMPISDFGNAETERLNSPVWGSLRAVWEMVRCRYVDPQFTHHSGFYILSSVAKATAYNRWILDQVQPYLGSRVLEAGAGIGNLSSFLIDRERLIMVDYDSIYTNRLRTRYANHRNVRVDQADLTQPADFQRWQGQQEAVQSILCSNVLEHLEPDEQVLRSFQETLVPGGHCVIVVPAGQWLYTPMDKELGHFRRYSQAELAEKMRHAGFEIVFQRQFSKVGSISWGVAGHLLRRKHLSPRQMVWFDRMLPIFKLFENLLPIPGMSLIMVGRKPELQAARKAA